jgi:hypothetical protein
MIGGDELYEFPSENTLMLSVVMDGSEEERFDDGIESDLVSPDLYDPLTMTDADRTGTSRER